VCVLIAAGVGASSFALLAPVEAAAATAGVALVLGIGLWFFARWLGRQSTLRHGKMLGKNLAESGPRRAPLERLRGEGVRRGARPRLSERHAKKRKESDEHFLPQFEAQKKAYEAMLVQVETEYTAQTEKLRRQRAAETKAEEETYVELRAKVERRLEAEMKHARACTPGKLAAANRRPHRRLGRDGRRLAGLDHGRERDVPHAAVRRERTLPGVEALARPDQPLAAPRADGRALRGRGWRTWRPSPTASPADARLAPPEELSAPVPAFLPFPIRCSVLLRAPRRRPRRRRLPRSRR